MLMMSGTASTRSNQLWSAGIFSLCVAAGTLWLFSRRTKKSLKEEEYEKVEVSELNVYPIKSCMEVSVESAQCTARGFQYDRMAQVTDKDGKYCTPRDEDKRQLFHVKPTLPSEASTMTLTSAKLSKSFHLHLSNANTTPVAVEVLEAPDKLTLDDYGDEVAQWLQAATNIKGCRLTAIGQHFNRSVQKNSAQGDAVPTHQPAPVSLADEAPYLLVNAASLHDLNQRLRNNQKTPVDMRRFRPNIVITGLQPWEEDSLAKIQIGPVKFHVWQRCGRCIMTTIDRDTLERKDGPEPLATLSTFRERRGGMRNFGMHLIPVEGHTDGKISIHDEVKILEYHPERREEWVKLFGSDHQ